MIGDKSARNDQTHEGCVYLVGAGPGDPGLITLAAIDALSQADAVIHDYLADSTFLEYAPMGAKLIDAGKRGYEKHLTQEEINDILIREFNELSQVKPPVIVRLKGGDPFIFGRGGEEALALAEAHIPFKIIPGITSGSAAPSYAGIPVTHRGVASTVTFITGNEDPAKHDSCIDWNALARLAMQGGTLCFYMGVRNLAAIAERFRLSGLAQSTPAAVIQWGTKPNQKTVVSDLESIAGAAHANGVTAPAMIVVGDVVRLRDSLSWFETQPLFGRTILVTRSRTQASELSELLKALGADVIELPTIQITPMTEDARVRKSLASMNSYDWIVFTSVNGVEMAFDELDAMGKDSRAFAGCKIAAIGSATAESLGRHGIIADVVPGTFKGEDLAAAILENGAHAGQQVLVLRAAKAREILPDILADAGMEVDVIPIYETSIPDIGPDLLKEALEAADTLTFTSSSTVANFMSLLEKAGASIGQDGEKDILATKKIYSIGPITSAAIRDFGIEPTGEAEIYTIDGLVQAILDD